MKKIKQFANALKTFVKAWKELHKNIHDDPINTKKQLLVTQDPMAERYINKCEKRIRQMAKEEIEKEEWRKGK